MAASSLRRFALPGTMLVLTAAAFAQTGDTTSPPGMVLVPGTAAQPVGMDEAEIKAFLTDDVPKSMPTSDRRYDFYWKLGALFMGPRHSVPTADVWLGRYEVTNAQWRSFLEQPENQDSGTTAGGETLGGIAKLVWGRSVDPDAAGGGGGAAYQAAWLYLFERNRDVLLPALGGDDPAGFDPIGAQAGEKALPAGLELRWSIIRPPTYWKGGVVPEDELDRPVRELSWDDARSFCRWAGLHLPLEAEWERGARGDAGRRFPWGDDWDARRCVWVRWNAPDEQPTRPEPVDGLAAGATPDGVQHLLGNVSEWVYDLARRYPGSKSGFKHDNSGVLARGGSYDDPAHVMLAADRIWDMGQTQIGPQFRAETFGFRTAAYPDPARDIALDTATFATETFRTSGLPFWFPHPVGLGAKDREKKEKREPLVGFDLDAAAGWIERRMAGGDAAHHVYVTGPARGVAFLPVKGILATELKNRAAFDEIAQSAEETPFVGALLVTPGAVLHLVDEGGEKALSLPVGDLDDDRFWVRHELDFTYQVGAWLVLRAGRVAVYPGSGAKAGNNGYHLKGPPLGYLEQPWAADFVSTDVALPQGGYVGEVASLTARLPQLEKDGTPKKGGKAVRLTIQAHVTFPAK